MSAIAASGAHATAGVFAWENGTQRLVAEADTEGGNETTGVQKFQTFVGEVECQQVSDEISVTGIETHEITAQLSSYHDTEVSTCKGPLGSKPTIEFGNCDYKFTAGEAIGETGMEITGKAHIECTAGQVVVNGGGLCTIKVPAQKTLGGHVVYKTITTTKNYVTLEATVTEIKYDSEGLCGKQTGRTDGTYSGNVIVKGFNGNPGTQTNIEVHAPSSAFTWEKGTQRLTAEQDTEGSSEPTGVQKFQTFVGEVQCQRVDIEAAVTGQEAQEITSGGILYHNTNVLTCSGPIGSSPTIEFGKCDYEFTVGETIGETGMETTGKAHIECTVGQVVVNGGALCTIKVPAQKAMTGHIVYKTIAATPSYVTAEATVTGIAYSSEGFCGKQTGRTDGTYAGNMIVRSFNDQSQTSMEVH